jgi:hypothetical protein
LGHPRWAGVQPEEHPEQHLVQLDPHEGFREMYKDGGVEDTVHIQMDVLDVVEVKRPTEELTGEELQSALDEAGEHQDLVWILRHRVGISGGSIPTIDDLLSQEVVVG